MFTVVKGLLHERLKILVFRQQGAADVDRQPARFSQLEILGKGVVN
jgi:hypothetical protein